MALAMPVLCEAIGKLMVQISSVAEESRVPLALPVLLEGELLSIWHRHP